MVSIPIIAAPERPQCMRHNIHGPWVVDGVDFHSCLILSYMNITSTLSHFTVDLSIFLKSLSSRNYLPVLLVSIFVNSSQLANHVVENKQKQLVIMSSTSDILRNTYSAWHKVMWTTKVFYFWSIVLYIWRKYEKYYELYSSSPSIGRNYTVLVQTSLAVH